MTKVTAPEPSAWRTRYRSKPGMVGHYPRTYAGCEPHLRVSDPYEIESLITTEQAEAYAAAKVRESLEWAAEIAKAKYQNALIQRETVDGDDDDNTEAWNLGQCAQALAFTVIETEIRALIPK